VLVAHDLAPEFLLFAPETTPEGGFYALFIETRSALAPAERQAILREIDSRLKENVQYRYARELGQLKEPEGVVLPPGRGQTAYLRRCLASGQRLGDIKQNLVDHRTGWTDWFAA
jgi:hypothetical protein